MKQTTQAQTSTLDIIGIVAAAILALVLFVGMVGTAAALAWTATGQAKAGFAVGIMSALFIICATKSIVED